MSRFLWRLQYAYYMNTDACIRWGISWDMSRVASEDWKGMEPKQAVFEDARDWF